MAVWRGPKSIKLVGVGYDDSSDRTQIELLYQGPRLDCIAKRPKVGAKVTGFDGRIVAVKVPMVQTPDGTIRVTLEAVTTDPTPAEEVGEPVYELEWGNITRKLEAHPKCGRIQTDGKSWDKWEEIVTADYEVVSGGWSFATWQAKRRRGQEEYPVAYPIARRRRQYTRRPNGVGANMYKISAPPSETSAPSSGWTYYKSADRLTREGRLYTREEEWTGAQELDTDIFS